VTPNRYIKSAFTGRFDFERLLKQPLTITAQGFMPDTAWLRRTRRVLPASNRLVARAAGYPAAPQHTRVFLINEQHRALDQLLIEGRHADPLREAARRASRRKQNTSYAASGRNTAPGRTQNSALRQGRVHYRCKFRSRCMFPLLSLSGGHLLVDGVLVSLPVLDSAEVLAVEFGLTGLPGKASSRARTTAKKLEIERVRRVSAGDLHRRTDWRPWIQHCSGAVGRVFRRAARRELDGMAELARVVSKRRAEMGGVVIEA